MDTRRKIAVVGGGIAGLCAAVLARKCGYDVEVFEQHGSAGGLATSWRRGDYTFETCLHWLLGSRPGGMLNAQWREVFDIGALSFLDPEEYARVENERGERLIVYSHADRMEAELLRAAPRDAGEIRRFAAAVRSFGSVELPDPGEGWAHALSAFLHALPALPALNRLSGLTIADYAERFTHPLLRRFFFGGDTPNFMALAVVFALAWMNERNAGYPIGGSQAVIKGIVAELERLGGRLRLEAPIEQVLVENDAATGVRLASGETVAADFVLSAADGHAMIYDLLGAKYVNESIAQAYGERETFPSYVQVSLGVARELTQLGRFIIRVLDVPLAVDPLTALSQLSFRIFNFDPTFAPPGSTAVTCFLPTGNALHWTGLERHDPARYHAEKERIANAVIDVFAKIVPDVRNAIEVVDVSTPATVIRFTRNWKGSYEGWLPTPSTGIKPLPHTLPGLRKFVMAGQWVSPGGGLPGGLMTARAAVREICKQDRVPFLNATVRA